jgi:hypothetical protein
MTFTLTTYILKLNAQLLALGTSVQELGRTDRPDTIRHDMTQHARRRGGGEDVIDSAL